MQHGSDSVKAGDRMAPSGTFTLIFIEDGINDVSIDFDHIGLMLLLQARNQTVHLIHFKTILSLSRVISIFFPIYTPEQLRHLLMGPSVAAWRFCDLNFPTFQSSRPTVYPLSFHIHMKEIRPCPVSVLLLNDRSVGQPPKVPRALISGLSSFVSVK